MDSTQKEEVRELKHVLGGIKGNKCIPCRVVFFFSLVVFLCVIVFMLYTRIRAQSQLEPVPPELTHTMSPQEYEQGLLRLEDVFHPRDVAALPEAAASSSTMPPLQTNHP